MSLASHEPAGTARIGEFTYLSASTEASLYRNGRVFTRRDGSGNDGVWEGADLTPCRMPIEDARELGPDQRRTLGKNGFERLDCPISGSGIDFFEHDQIVGRYYPHCQDIIRQSTGARVVAAFDHNIRSVSGNENKRRIEGGQQVQPPLHMVHGDYTLTSAPQRLRDLAKPPTGNDTFRTALADNETLLDEADVERALGEGRFAIINLWRNIATEPVATHPLALCDAQSLDPQDLVVFEIHYADRIGENYYAKQSGDHCWYVYPGLTRDEALLIKQWDSAGELARSHGKSPDAMRPEGPCTFSLHSAFEDPQTPPDAPDRWSIEVRCAVLYD